MATLSVVSTLAADRINTLKENSELIKLNINNEKKKTINHPFYVMDRGFVKASELRAGDILCTVNGTKVVVELVQHEILESPVKVYNFSVEGDHTYFVGENCVGVHNDGCGGVPEPERTQAENGLYYKSNPKHTPGGSGNRFNAGIEPKNSLELFGESVENPSNSLVRFSYDENTDAIHRFLMVGVNGIGVVLQIKDLLLTIYQHQYYDYSK